MTGERDYTEQVPSFFFLDQVRIYNLCDAICHYIPHNKSIGPQDRKLAWLMKVILCNFKVWEINLRLQPWVCLAKSGNNFCKKGNPHPGLLRVPTKLTALLGKRPNGSGELKRLKSPTAQRDRAASGSVPGSGGSRDCAAGPHGVGSVSHSPRSAHSAQTSWQQQVTVIFTCF